MVVTTLGSFSGANSKDKSARIPGAISALNKALAGDSTALLTLRQQAAGSATAVGKDAYSRALAIYDANKPAATTPVAPAQPIAIVPPSAVIPLPYFLPTPPSVLLPAPTATVPTEGPSAAPVGFDTGQVLIDPVPVVGGVTVTGLRPHLVTPIIIGSRDGGVIAGPPAPEYSGSGAAPLADASFGYVAPTPTVEAAPSTVAAIPPGATDNKIILLLVVAVLLFIFIDGKRK